MNAAKILAPALFALGLVTMEQGAFAQAPAPDLPGEDAKDSGSPAIEDDRGPVSPDAAPSKVQKAAEEAPPARSTFVLPVVESQREQPAPAKPQAQPRNQHWSVGLGFTAAVVEGEGYDPYSKNNALPMFSLFGTFTPWFTRPASVHLAAQYDFGSSSAPARGAEATLDVHRLALGIEGRYAPISRMMLFVRAMPAAVHLGGSLKDPYLGASLESGQWTFAADVTGGAAARVGAVGHRDLPAVSFWLGLDMGYRFAPPVTLKYRPGNLTDEDAGRHFGEIATPPLDLSGFIGKLSFSVSF